MDNRDLDELYFRVERDSKWINRNLDGLYFRVKRDDIWRNICFSDLTGKERYEVMKDKDEEWLKSTCNYLADRVRQLGDNFNIVGEIDI